jgi:hypothetical protein
MCLQVSKEILKPSQKLKYEKKNRLNGNMRDFQNLVSGRGVGGAHL